MPRSVGNAWNRIQVNRGDKYSNLTIEEELNPFNYRKNANRLFRCVCDCGRVHIASLNGLRSGTVKHCSSYSHKEEWMKNVGKWNKTHGMSHSSEYRAWSSARSRCYNKNVPNYPAYGGRGIGMSEEWRDFSAFFRDMGQRPSAKHSLDRINVDGDYEKNNCRWATQEEQQNNKRCACGCAHCCKSKNKQRFQKELGKID